ncbi:uncharacterized protein An02g00270 [Aspergillus niger]|uniref:Contig An02c0010, genomic contig n=2 Tax=Aspergillus niger TaxID=5061 RepID=A2QBJ5_ASPNC|nr:uncharacterized protein An02g00270 [Aspergillus niger]CAK96242.1 unnamed protein product [Aspergillus niger]
MHRSITLDYITVTQGVVTLSTDDGSTVTLRAGDTVVQRGTMHKWGNPSDEWARLTSVMVQARPVVVDGKEMEADVLADLLSYSVPGLVRGYERCDGFVWKAYRD